MEQLDRFDFTFFEELDNANFDNSAIEEKEGDTRKDSLPNIIKKQKISLDTFNVLNVFDQDLNEENFYVENAIPKSNPHLYLPEIVDNNGDLEHLFHVPKLLEEYINMGNEEDLIELLTEICTDDVILQTSAMNRCQEIGVQYITNMFASATRTMPDLIYILKTINYNQKLGIITAVAYLSGTKIYKDQYDYLYNCLQSESSPMSVTPELRHKARDILNRGERYQVSERVAYYFILTSDCSKIKQFSSVHSVMDVRQAPQVAL